MGGLSTYKRKTIESAYRTAFEALNKSLGLVLNLSKVQQRFSCILLPTVPGLVPNPDATRYIVLAREFIFQQHISPEEPLRQISKIFKNPAFYSKL